MVNSAMLTTESRLRGADFDITELVQNLPGVAYRCRWNGTWSMEFVSDGCRRVTGYEPEEMVGESALPWQSLLHPDDFSAIATEITLATVHRDSFQVVYRVFTKDGAERWFMEEGRVVSAPDEESICMEGFISDITVRKQTEMSLREANQTIGRLIREDPLTGLANRRALEEYMVRSLSFSRRWQHPLSIIMAGIDHFKAVNGRYGHLTGDRSWAVFPSCSNHRPALRTLWRASEAGNSSCFYKTPVSNVQRSWPRGFESTHRKQSCRFRHISLRVSESP
jgi:PAS domain S-box-containing protein